jgi:hypothetical protein
MSLSLDQRIDRLESVEAIRQLPYRYALAADSRDTEALVELYAENGAYYPSGERIPRDQLNEWLKQNLRQYGATQHFMCNHIIEIDDEDHAHGIVYCYAGQERGEQWIVLAMMYEDKYERRNGSWYFTERRGSPWYYTDWDEKPVGPNKLRLPNRPPAQAPLPERWPSWQRYWDDVRSAT